jgi:hypothetical protein
MNNILGTLAVIDIAVALVYGLRGETLKEISWVVKAILMIVVMGFNK